MQQYYALKLIKPAKKANVCVRVVSPPETGKLHVVYVFELVHYMRLTFELSNLHYRRQ